MEDKVKWVYSSKNDDELTKRYDVWAKSYEQELEAQFGYRKLGPEPAVDVFVKYVSPDARILDAGAGTGLVGEILAKRGYEQIIAMDISPGMLKQAEQKKVYKALHQGTLGSTLDFPTASFDAIISVGVFTYGHAKSNAFDELIRITNPGGYIIFTLPVELYENSDFKTKLISLEFASKWSKVKATEPVMCHLKQDHNVQLQIWVYKIS